MNKVLHIILISLFSITIISCSGEDGKDGNAYLSINWVYAPTYYNDTNSSIPNIFYKGVKYKTLPGTYSFIYTAWSGDTWSGYYIITINSGEKGESTLFIIPKDGSDGADTNFSLYLYSFGPSIYNSREKINRELSNNNKTLSEKHSKIDFLKKNKDLIKDYKNDLSNVFEEEFVNSDHVIKLVYWKLNKMD